VVRTFRRTIGIGASRLWHLTWLLVLALAIGGEETLEGTLIVFALTRGRDVRLRVPGA